MGENDEKVTSKEILAMLSAHVELGALSYHFTFRVEFCVNFSFFFNIFEEVMTQSQML